MNSAQRLEQIFRTLRDRTPPVQPNQAPTGIDTWAAVFDRVGLSGHDLEDAAQECALAVREELGYLTHQLSDASVPEPLYANHVAHLREITASRFFHVEWRQLAGNVKEENLTMLQWAGLYLGGTLNQEVDEEVTRLTSEIDKLLAEVQSTNLPPSLRSFLLRNLRSVKNSLWRYKASGLGPLRDALQTMRGTGDQQRQEIREAAENLTEPERALWKRAAQTFNTAVNVCDKATKLDKGYALASDAVKALIDLWP
jgi:hypothetical protein